MTPPENRSQNADSKSDVVPSGDAPDTPFDWDGRAARFRGRIVEHRRIDVAGMALQIAAMKDATDLLDEPDFAKRFIENDIAPYGVELWPAAIVLAEYLVGRGTGPNAPFLPQGGEQDQGVPERTLNRHVAASAAPRPVTAIELGCGLGLVAIVAAKLGWRVTASDYESTALAFASYNARLNSAPVAEWMTLDWRNPPADRQYDVILGADILYQLVDHGPILACVRRMLAPGGTALIADPNRGVADRFAETASEAGIGVETIICAASTTGKQASNGRIFRLCGGAATMVP